MREKIQNLSNKVSLLLVTPWASAAVTPKAGQSANPNFPTPPSDVSSASDVISAVNNVAAFSFKLFTALAVIFIIAAAFFYLTAAGNQTQLDRAKNVLIYAIVAVVIALIAGGTVSFLKDVAGIP